MQLKHDLAFLTRNNERLTLFEAFLNHWRVLTSSQPPKGLEKDVKPPKPESSSSTSEEKQSKSDDATTKPPPSTTASKSSSDASKPPPDWNFGMFGPTAGPKGSSQQGQGRPIGGEQQPDQTRMLIFGALGFVAFVGALTYIEMGYKEISWKDFVNRSVKKCL